MKLIRKKKNYIRLCNKTLMSYFVLCSDDCKRPTLHVIYNVFLLPYSLSHTLILTPLFFYNFAINDRTNL